MAEARQAQGNVKPMAGAAEEKKIAPLKRGDAQLFELSGNHWRVIVKDDVTPQDLDMHPVFWNLLADSLQEGDGVKALWNSGKHVALYEIVNVANGVVAARLAYAVEGAPLLSAVGPKSFPAGYHIEKSRKDEPNGFVVVRESDGHRINTSGGVPWRTYQDAYTEFPKLAIFRTEDSVQRWPGRHV